MTARNKAYLLAAWVDGATVGPDDAASTDDLFDSMLLVSGSNVGSASTAQDFGANGVKVDSIVQSTTDAGITLSSDVRISASSNITGCANFTNAITTSGSLNITGSVARSACANITGCTLFAGVVSHSASVAHSACATFSGSVKFGSSGTIFSTILAGSSSCCVPGINASSMGAGSIAIAGLNANSVVFFSGASVANASAALGYCVNNVGTTGAAGASVFFANLTGADGGASTMGFHYIAFVPA